MGLFLVKLEEVSEDNLDSSKEASGKRNRAHHSKSRHTA